MMPRLVQQRGFWYASGQKNVEGTYRDRKLEGLLNRMARERPGHRGNAGPRFRRVGAVGKPFLGDGGRRMKRAPFVVACAVLAASSAWAAGGIETKPMHFAKGASSATVKGSIKGDETIDYALGAKAGQTMSVKLTASNAASYFNVLPPGSNDVAIFVGSTSGNEWTGELPASGEYKIRVYLMRSAARRNETASYTLTVCITGGASAAAGLGTAPASDAKVAGTPYHATGQVPCSMGNAPQGSAQCDFGVIRGKPGNAEVHVKPAGGLERVLVFKGSSVTSGDEKVKASMSDDGLWSIEVNDYEHYQIPESVISGG